MKIYAVIAGIVMAFGSLAADVNITNVTRAVEVPSGSYALGTTGLVTRLLPINLMSVDHATSADSATTATNLAGPIASLSIGTLTVTNPPVLDLRSSTNLNANTTSYPTNSSSTTINMLLKEADFQTNAAFAFAGFSNLNGTNYQHKAVHVFYTGFGQSSGVAITWPANTHVQGTSYLTNQTDVAIDYNPLIPITNVLCLPKW